MIPLQDDVIWNNLLLHQHALAHYSLTDLMSIDEKRKQQLIFSFADLQVDLSANFLSQETLSLLLKLAQNRNLETKIQDLFSGKKVNFTENRSALHSALRTPKDETYCYDKIIHDDIHLELERFLDFSEKIRKHEIKSFSNKPFTDIVNVGVGGSSLGPELFYHALKNTNSLFNIHFISSMDGEETQDLLAKLPLDTTLFIISSKSFTTLDTLSNAKVIKKFFQKYTEKSDHFQKNMVAISTNTSAMTDFGILPENQFKIWDFVGGRYSIWSAVSLIVAIALGKKVFLEFLQGGFEMDTHFKTTPFHQNIPILLALVDIWYTNFLKYPSLAILPYSSRLKLLPAYLQQLFMESLGKSVNSQGHSVTIETGRILWGDVGFIGQHAFFQLFHQGTCHTQIEFLISEEQHNTPEECKFNAIANALGQKQALTVGQNHSNSHLNYPGNKPSTTISFAKITSKFLGQLLALYEHRVYVQASIWDINPFDQWGVELGKILAHQMKENLFHK